MKIAVVGAGYVGLSLATLLSQENEVIVLDIDNDKIKMINNRISPIKDKYIENYFNKNKLNLSATLNYIDAFSEAEFIIISTPTNYDDKKRFFDTKSIEDIVLKVISMNINPTIIIKSTVPIGFTESIKRKYDINNVIFSPEFLREGHALYDNLYPTRIIVGEKSKKAEQFGNLLKKITLKKDVVIKYMSNTEAEAVKLFSNTYLALRIAFFNELDTYSEVYDLNTRDIIDGLCLDSRIGNYYNNPSFGYGGYCLPKDTKQLQNNFKGIPENLISAVVASNITRKKHIAQMIVDKHPKVVGIYKLDMKYGSDNYRSSAVIDIIKIIKHKRIKIVIFDSKVNNDTFLDCDIINNINEFKRKADIIVANRIDKELQDVQEKVYSRDIFNNN